MTRSDEVINFQIELAKLSERIENLKESSRSQLDACHLCKNDFNNIVTEQRQCCKEAESFNRAQLEINKNIVSQIEVINEDLGDLHDAVKVLENSKIAVFIKLVFLIGGVILAALFKLDILKY